MESKYKPGQTVQTKDGTHWTVMTVGKLHDDGRIYYRLGPCLHAPVAIIIVTVEEEEIVDTLENVKRDIFRLELRKLCVTYYVEGKDSEAYEKMLEDIATKYDMNDKAYNLSKRNHGR